MKKWHLIFIFLLLIIPVQSFALIDASVFGGYTFSGDLKTEDLHFKHVQGFDYGIMGHFNLNLSVFMIGLGALFQGGVFTYDANGRSDDFNINSSFGPDFIAMVMIKKICPYMHIGLSLVDRLDYEFQGERKHKSRLLNSGWWSIGVGYQAVKYLILFTEYQRCETKLNKKDTFTRNTIKAGAMFLF